MGVWQMASQSLRIVIADDHAIMRDGLRAILESKGFEVVGETSDGLEAVRLCHELRPDLVAMDISMPLLNGIDAAREIIKVSPRTKIIALSMHTEPLFILACLRAGMVAYVLKSKTASILIQAIEAVRKGDIYLTPDVSKTVLDAYLGKLDASVDPLSSREREVLQLIAEGKNIKEIGCILGISTKTAESHRANIMDKLDIREIAGLVRYAIQHGLTQIG